MSKLADAIFSDHCVLCRMPLRPRLKHLSCNHCWQALPWLANPCRHCALPLTAPGVCGHCQTRPLSPGKAAIPLAHSEEGQYLIHRFKFNRGLREGQTLSQAMLLSIYMHYQIDTLPQALLPVPLAALNQARRGFNQASVLAKAIGIALSLPVLYPFSRRHGPAQRTLNKRKRELLPHSIFRQRMAVGYNHVAIVDDVLTTGSTVRALATALGKSGVSQIDVWCATRTVATVGHARTL